MTTGIAPVPVTSFADAEGRLHKTPEQARLANFRIELDAALYKEGGYADAEELPHIGALLYHLPLLYELLGRYPDLIVRAPK